MTSSADSYPPFSEKQVNMDGQGSQVKKSCACCKMYMDHLHGKMTCFLMPMSANYRHSMTMPARFMNQFGGEISESIHIESPDGSVYAVKGTKYMNKMLPQCGWKAFIDAHHIEENDSLLFQHIEKASFKVLIIDPDGCEKVIPCGGIRISSSNIQEGDKDCVDVSDRSHDRVDKSSRVWKRVSSCQRDCPSQRRKATTITKTSASSSEGSGADSEGTAEYECSSGFDDDPQTNAAPGYVLSCMSILSGDQEEQVDAVIKDIQPETTVFVAVMKPSHVKPYRPILVNSSRLCSRALPTHKSSGDASAARQEQEVASQASRQESHMLAGPWSDFVQDNHVQAGDICIFQPLKTAASIKFMVHLIRRQSKVGVLHEHGNSPGSGSSRGRTTRAKANEHKIVRSGEGRAKGKVTPIARVKEEPANQAPSSPCNCHLTDDESGDSGEPSKAGLYILSSHARLDDDQRKKVEDIVGSIQSEVPIYVAVMNKISVAVRGSCVLYFSKRYTSKYLQFQHGEHTVTLVRNRKSSAWKVKMHAQMFSKGWRDFVRDNCLKLHDICLFQLTKDDIKMLTMTVYIIRHV